MGKKRNIPVYNRGNAARQTQRKYLGSKMTQAERVQKNREAAGHVISMCFLVALNNRYGIGEERLGPRNGRGKRGAGAVRPGKAGCGYGAGEKAAY